MPRLSDPSEVLKYPHILLDIGDTLVKINEPFEVYTRRGLGYLYDFLKLSDIDRETFVDQAFEVRGAIRKEAHRTLKEFSFQDYLDWLIRDLQLSEDFDRTKAEAAFIPAEWEITLLYSDVLPFLQKANDLGRSLWIVTNNFTADQVHLVLGSFGIKPFVNRIFVSGEMGVRKPNLAFFVQVQNEIGFQGKDAIIIGDKAHMDVLGGHQAGWQTALILRGKEAQVPEGIPEPDYYIDGLI